MAEVTEDGYVLEARGLYLTRDLTRTEWAALGKTIVGRQEGSVWALGDWLVYGGRQGIGGRWIGSSYKLATEITGYSASHLSSAHNVAQTFPRKDRVPMLAWSLYREVLNQPDKMRLLDMARRKKWTSLELATYIDTQRPQAAKAATHARSNEYTPVHVKCPDCKSVFPAREHRVPRHLVPKTV